MDTILLDACFIIGLRDCGKTRLLLEVAKLLSWKLYLPQAVYEECIAKKDDPLLCEMISKGQITLCKSPPTLFLKCRDRYSGLGNGELDALAFALSLIPKEDDPISMITTDQKTLKIAKNLGINTLTTLDFFKNAYKLKLMTRDEIHQFVPILKEKMWLSDKVLTDFLREINEKEVQDK